MKHLLPYQFITMFVMSTRSNYGTHYLQKSKLKKTDRHTGESPALFFIHDKERVDGDRSYYSPFNFLIMSTREHDSQERLASTLEAYYGPEWKQTLVAAYFHIAHHVLMGCKGNTNDTPQEVYQAIDVLWITLDGLTAAEES